MISLENLVPGESDGDRGEKTRRNFERLAALVLDTGGQSAGVRFGTATVTWAGVTQFSGSTTVDHGLGRVPVATFAGAMGTTSPGGQHANIITGGTPTATQFTVAAALVATAAIPTNGTTLKVAWLVIG